VFLGYFMLRNSPDGMAQDITKVMEDQAMLYTIITTVISAPIPVFIYFKKIHKHIPNWLFPLFGLLAVIILIALLVL
jgi:hypothetical protein